VRSESKGRPAEVRTIQSMGKTSSDRAVVYTASADGVKQEEVWVKSGGTWTLETKTAVR